MNKNANPISDTFRDSNIPQLTAVYLIDEEHNNKYARLFHSHDTELELYFVYSGSGYYMIENQLFAVNEGDMIICNAGVLHGDATEFENSLRSYCCALTNVRIKEYPDNWLTTTNSSPVISCGSLASRIGQTMELLYMLSLDFEKQYDVCSSLANSILLLTHQLLQSRSRHKERYIENKIDAVVSEIKTYLDTNYAKQLTLEKISKALNMSPDYVSHVFKAEMKISPIQYQLYRRFGEAQSLLMNTELTMAEISDLLGFSNPAHFSAMFKKHVGISPKQYKQSIQDMNHKMDDFM